MKKEDLKNFENRLLEDVIHKCNIGYISNVCKMFVDFYKKNSSLDSLSEFMRTYIYYIGEYNGKRTLTKITESVFIECFDSKDFLAKKENLNHFKNFTTIENYPLFIFYLKNRYKNEGFIGILYWDNFFDEFDIQFPKKNNGEYFTVKINENIELSNSSPAEFINKLRTFVGLKEIDFETIEKNTLIEEFDEFLSIVLNLNEDYKSVIEPLGLNLLEKIKNIENKD